MSETPESVNYCSHCGHNLSNDENYCPECGNAVDPVNTKEEETVSESPAESSTESDSEPETAVGGFYYRIVLIAGLISFGSATFTIIGGPWPGVVAIITTLSGWLMAYAIYRDALLVQKAVDWGGSAKVWALGAVVPYIGIFTWIAYLHTRKQEAAIQKGRYLDYENYRDIGIVSSILAVFVLPIVFAPLAMYCGFRMTRLESTLVGAVVIGLGMMGGFLGFIFGVIGALLYM